MRRRAAVACALTLALGTACDLGLVDTDARAPVAVRFQIEEAPDTALFAVLRKVYQARVELSRDGETVDTVFPFDVADGPIRLRVLLVPPAGEGALRVRAELDAAVGTLFAGDGVIARGAVESEGTVTLEAVPEGLSANTLTYSIDALGEPVPVVARVVFVTGDVIPGLRPRLTSADPSIAEVADDSTLISRGNGQAAISVSYEGMSLNGTVRVRQVPDAVLGITPGDTTVSVGDTVQYRLLGADSNGHALLPGAFVNWVAVGGAATIDTLGLAVAVAEGESNIIASNTSASSPLLTVVP